MFLFIFQNSNIDICSHIWSQNFVNPNSVYTLTQESFYDKTIIHLGASGDFDKAEIITQKEEKISATFKRTLSMMIQLSLPSALRTWTRTKNKINPNNIFVLKQEFCKKKRYF